MKALQVGDKVRLTGAFLRSTGQQAGGEGQKRWIVQPCSCRSCANGHLILTDEPRPDDGTFTAEEIAKEPHLKYRHINTGNLEKCR